MHSQETHATVSVESGPLSRLIDSAFDHLREYNLDVRDPRTSALFARIAESLIELDREVAAHAAWIGKRRTGTSAVTR